MALTFRLATSSLFYCRTQVTYHSGIGATQLHPCEYPKMLHNQNLRFLGIFATFSASPLGGLRSVKIKGFLKAHILGTWWEKRAHCKAKGGGSVCSLCNIYESIV